MYDVRMLEDMMCKRACTLCVFWGVGCQFVSPSAVRIFCWLKGKGLDNSGLFVVENRFLIGG